jgi:aminodeoxyfutalosine synthase
MTISSIFDTLQERVSGGERLGADDLAQLVATPDILQLGMLADTVRRRVHGAQVTYVRVALCPFDMPFTDAVPLAAREIRVTGTPETLEVAVTAVEAARAVAGERAVSAFSWLDVERLATQESHRPSTVLERLRSAGLDALAELPLDRLAKAADVIETIVAAGYRQLRLTIDTATADVRPKLFVDAAALQEKFPAIRSINPLPTVLDALRPTTGYEDVKSVAIARLAAPNIPTIQVDWLRYGPKLAQVALTFGADDIDNVTASDEAPDGRRRAPLEEVRRNIEAAGLEPAERDGRFELIV